MAFSITGFSFELFSFPNTCNYTLKLDAGYWVTSLDNKRGVKQLTGKSPR